MKKLLSLLFASMVVLSLTMPAIAADSTTNSAPSAAKTHKAKSNKNHAASKTNKAGKTSKTAAPASTNAK